MPLVDMATVMNPIPSKLFNTQTSHNKWFLRMSNELAW